MQTRTDTKPVTCQNEYVAAELTKSGGDRFRDQDAVDRIQNACEDIDNPGDGETTENIVVSLAVWVHDRAVGREQARLTDANEEDARKAVRRDEYLEAVNVVHEAARSARCTEALKVIFKSIKRAGYLEALNDVSEYLTELEGDGDLSSRSGMKIGDWIDGKRAGKGA